MASIVILLALIVIFLGFILMLLCGVYNMLKEFNRKSKR